MLLEYALFLAPEIQTMRLRFTPIFCGMLLMVAAITAQTTYAETVSFLVDPDTIDANMDGFITGNEFQPVGTDGTIFDLEPTANLVGGLRFLLSDDQGIHYGGGGGSTLAFAFSVNRDISLESYTLASTGFFLGNPEFNIEEGATELSSLNTSNASGDTHAFNGGPIALTAGTTYTFETQVNGAAIQAFMESWTYSSTAIPEPGALGLLMLSAVAMGARRSR